MTARITETIPTATGPVDAGELGLTLMHEHLVFDLTHLHRYLASLFSLPSLHAGLDADTTVTAEMHTEVRWHGAAFRDNWIVDDARVVTEELRFFREAGGRSILDLTPLDLGRDVGKVRAIASRTSVNVLLGSAFYIERSHPEWLNQKDVEWIADFFEREVAGAGIDASGIQAAVIGEIGTSDPPTQAELKVLRAAALAAARTGTSLHIHLTAPGMHALSLLEEVREQGLGPERVVMCHMDSWSDRGVHEAVAETGAVLSFDTFGYEHYFGALRVRSLTDFERFEAICHLAEQGYEDQIVIGHDKSTKDGLKRFGGSGYDHILRHILPAFDDGHRELRDLGRRILIETPRRLLSRVDSDVTPST